MKKMLVIAADLAWSLSSPEEVGVSKVKANPERYVGKMKMIGLTGRTDASQGLLEIAGEQARCTLVLEVRREETRGVSRGVRQIPRER